MARPILISGAVLLLLLSLGFGQARELLDVCSVHHGGRDRRLFSDGCGSGAGSPCCCQPVEGETRPARPAAGSPSVGLYHCIFVTYLLSCSFLHRTTSLLWLLLGPQPVVPFLRVCSARHSWRVPAALPLPPCSSGKSIWSTAAPCCELTLCQANRCCLLATGLRRHRRALLPATLGPGGRLHVRGRCGVRGGSAVQDLRGLPDSARGQRDCAQEQLRHVRGGGGGQ